ncbi:MAG: SGNH/GDSL hydrolase family protein [Parasphingorhabdus sp.]|nr:SGNH/GDSL hydrolase family protein [Parasphingorhabdus sp.]
MAMNADATARKSWLGSQAVTSSVGGSGTFTGIRLGEWFTAINRMLGDIHEIIIYPSVLSDAEVLQVQDYLETKWKATNRATDKLFIFEGDSTTAGVDSSDADGDVAPYFPARFDWSYPAQMMRGLTAPRPKWYNFGAGGDTMLNMQTATNLIDTMTLEESAAYPNKYVVIMGGTNDIAQGKTNVEIQGYHTAFINNIRAAHPTAIIIGCTILPRNSFTAPQKQQITDINTWLKTSAGYDQIVDWDLVPEAADASNTTYYPDFIHPSRALKAIMADYMKSRLQSWGYL